jgi:hypothetical protein
MFIGAGLGRVVVLVACIVTVVRGIERVQVAVDDAIGLVVVDSDASSLGVLPRELGLNERGVNAAREDLSPW